MKYVLTLFAVMFFTGCTGSNISKEWNCPIDQPDHCNSVSEGDAIALDALRGDDLLPPLMAHNTAQTSETIAAKRIDEELASIWIGAFVDDAGNYHPPAELYIVVQPARWAQP